MFSLLRRLMLISGLCLLSACGGGSTGGIASSSTGSTGSGGSTTTVDATGVWSGSYSIAGSSGSTDIVALIGTGSSAFFYDQAGVVYVLPTFTGGTTLSGNLLAVAPAGVTLSDGQSTELFTVTATVSATSITGSFTGNGETGTFTLTPLAAFGGNPSIVAGNWQGFYIGSGSTAAVDVEVQSGGTIAGSDSDGCHLTGNISAPTDDVFPVVVTSSGNGCPGTLLVGLAFESNRDLGDLFGGTVGTYYYVTVDQGDLAFVAELKVQ
jgi:hypothetical protein